MFCPPFYVTPFATHTMHPHTALAREHHRRIAEPLRGGGLHVAREV